MRLFVALAVTLRPPSVRRMGARICVEPMPLRGADSRFTARHVLFGQLRAEAQHGERIETNEAQFQTRTGCGDE